MSMKWKSLLLACLLATQLTGVANVASAEAARVPAQADSQQSSEQPSQGEGTHVNPALNSNEGQRNKAVEMENPEQEAEEYQGSEGLVGSESNAETESGQDQAAVNASGIDTSIYGDDILVIVANSNLMVLNNVEYRAPQPITVKNGVSFVSLRTLVERFGAQLDYDSKTKESIISFAGKELRYQIGTKSYKVDGTAAAMSGTSYLQDGTFMVPLTSALQAFQMPYKWEAATKRIIVELAAEPVAKFTIAPKDIYATQTEVKVTDESYHPRGLKIINQEWTGLETYYAEPGLHTVTLRVQDESGAWSEPYSVTFNVLPKHEPPVADFKTDKETYKMGEFIQYTDLSSADQGFTLEYEWNNNKPAFFEPGRYTITLRVTDNLGYQNEIAKTITVTNDLLYTFEEFNLVYSKPGEVYDFKGSSITSMKLLKPTIRHNQRTMFRSNSPESIVENGIIYQDTITGGTRIFMHHRNATSKNMNLYIVVKNISSTPTTVEVEHYGLAGPNPYPQETGKRAAVKYFDSFRNISGIMSQQVLKPGEAKVFIPELSQTPLKPEHIYSMYADFFANNNVQYQIVALDSSKDVMKELSKLEILESKDNHIRGTFNNADRTFTIDELIGDTDARLVFGDNTNDPIIQGWDAVTGQQRKNAGNYGVLYKVTLNRVAPNTAISFNGRGGSYAGALLVNGETVQLPTNGVLRDANKANIVYRTGDKEEKVEILFTPAAGSSMPVNLIFQQIPKAHS